MKLILATIAAMLLLTAHAENAGSVSVKPEQLCILLPANAGAVPQFAARELQKHLELICGKPVAIRSAAETLPAGLYPIRLSPPASGRALLPEEAVCEITARGAWLYGDDTPLPAFTGDTLPENFWNSRTGTLSAVYQFLEQQFGVLWVEPGDAGIHAPRQSELRLTPSVVRWNPGQLAMRQIRGPARWSAQNANPDNPLYPTQQQYNAQRQETLIWLKRQRMGRNIELSYGHAFDDWFKRYGKEHPEYFALQENGKREQREAHGAKLCVSNPNVARLVVDNWRKSPGDTINTCENDGGFFCRCPECLKLDTRRPDETRLEDHLTDRYLFFTNRVQSLARQIRPDVSAVMYAYGSYKMPPRREKVSPGVIIGFVPSLYDEGDPEEAYRNWRQAGAQKIFLRPNDFHSNTGLPLGFEKLIFERFRLALKYGVIGTDYDCLHGYWPATGIAEYILARAHVYPEKTFDELEAEYCSVYGSAQAEVKAYYSYWRTVWEQRIMPDHRKITEIGKYDNFQRGLIWSIGKYYRTADFDATDRILAQGLERPLSDAERERLKTLQLANRHARLTFDALNAAPQQKAAFGAQLLRFRLENREKLHFDWGRLLDKEKSLGDATGIFAAREFADYSAQEPVPPRWYFEIDPDKVGETQGWHSYPAERILAVWDRIYVGSPWERQSEKVVSPNLLNRLKNYDGIGWYATVLKINPAWKGSPVYLHFGGIDESAKIWLNGKAAGERPFLKPDDWKTPYCLRIDSFIDWEKSGQLLIVRVEDTGGQGGLWKSVSLLKQ